MELKYRLAHEDYMRFNALLPHRVYKYSPWLRSKLRVWLTSQLPLVAMAVLLVVLRAKDVIAESMFWMALVGYAWCDISSEIWRNFCRREYMRQMCAPDGPAFQEVRVRFDNDGFDTEMEGRTSRWNWHMVKDFTRNGDLDLLWLDRASALPIPARAFENAEARQHFADFVKAHIAARPD